VVLAPDEIKPSANSLDEQQRWRPSCCQKWMQPNVKKLLNWQAITVGKPGLMISHCGRKWHGH